MPKRNDLVRLGLNNPVFQRNWVALGKPKASRIFATIKKMLQLTWGQLYLDQGLKWEKITSVQAPHGIEAVYSLRITQARRATAFRDGDYLRFLTIERDHDATYGKNRSHLENTVTTNAGNLKRSHVDQTEGFGTSVHRRFAALDTIGLALPERSEQPRAAGLLK